MRTGLEPILEKLGFFGAEKPVVHLPFGSDPVPEPMPMMPQQMMMPQQQQMVMVPAPILQDLIAKSTKKQKKKAF